MSSHNDFFARIGVGIKRELLIDKVIPGEKVWNRGQLWAIPCSIVIEFEKWDGEELHVFGNSQNLTFGHLHEEKFLALFRFGDVRRYKWIHKCFKVRTPPLGEAVPNLPVVVDPVGGVELTRVTRWGQPVIKTTLEALQLIFAGFQVVTRKLEECVGNLKHEDVRMTMVVNDEDALDRAAHAKVFIVVLETLKTS